MKQLQNDFTTPEQSKRLLELGVPVDSANFSIDEWGRVHKIPQDNGNLLFSQLKRQTIYTIHPCWSVGRLIEIYNTCVDFDLDDGAAIVIFIQDESPIVQMMEMFEDKVGIMDFSKLED